MSHQNEKRVIDEQASNFMTQVLQMYFYKNTENYECVTDKTRQVQGIDAIFTFNGKQYHCDEKVAIDWRNLKTFACEVDRLNKNGVLGDGWFTTPGQVNNSYLFVWLDDPEIPKTTKAKSPQTLSDIKMMEIALIYKEKLKSYFLEIGWSDENLLKKSTQIRKAVDNNVKVYMGDLTKYGLKFSYSPKDYKEKPVNALVPRKTLIEMSDYTEKFEISRG